MMRVCCASARLGQACSSRSSSPCSTKKRLSSSLTRESIEVLGNHEKFDLEVVYVDDGSKDRSPALLSEIAEKDRRVCVITLSRNFGHQPAVTAGLRHASGDVVAVIDADLQDPVELIPEMFGKWREGYSVVYGVRRNRQEGLPKVWAYSVFYRLLSRVSADRVSEGQRRFLPARSVRSRCHQPASGKEPLCARASRLVWRPANRPSL